MTEECYNNFLNVIIADELRTDSDRHSSNYFLVKNPESHQYHDIIPIDFDLCQIMLTNINTQEDFLRFINENAYTAATPTGASDNPLTYARRIENIRNLLQSGKIPSKQVEFMKKYLSTKLSAEIRNIETPTHLHKTQSFTYDTFSRLEDYNVSTLGRDLEI